MSERIDHIALAMQRLEFDVSGSNATQVAAQALVNVVAAQVHATLALVEQQRIANLIAISEAKYPNGWPVAPSAIAEPVNEYSMLLKAEIREGLGL